MNPRYFLWLAALDRQDALLVEMAVMAWSVVAAWLLIDWSVAPQWRKAARWVVAPVCLGIYVITVWQAVL